MKPYDFLPIPIIEVLQEAFPDHVNLAIRHFEWSQSGAAHAGAMSAFVYYKFFSELKYEDVIERYKEKLQLVDCYKDPFCLLESIRPIQLGTKF